MNKDYNYYHLTKRAIPDALRIPPPSKGHFDGWDRTYPHSQLTSILSYRQSAAGGQRRNNQGAGRGRGNNDKDIKVRWKTCDPLKTEHSVPKDPLQPHRRNHYSSLTSNSSTADKVEEEEEDPANDRRQAGIHNT